MYILYLLIFLISPILLVISLISPKIINKNIHREFTRRQYSLVFIISTILFFILTGITIPESSTPSRDVATEKVQIDTEQNGDVLGSTETQKETQGDVVLVTKVIDGDTIEVEGGEVVRYIGIDTPETVHPSKPVQCYGEEASEKNKLLVEGKEVRLEKDTSERDVYERLLRYVWIGDQLINEILVKEGFANSSAYPPDVKYQDRFNEAEKFARENKKGLWSEVCVGPSPDPTPLKINIPTSTPKTTITPTAQPYVAPITQAPAINSSPYLCNCSKTCSQMSGCEEAYYQLNTCGCSARDGDDDGVPCESICR